jgi:anthranilate phosphoribosyltransferase
VIAFNGEDGLDELSIAGPSRIVELSDGDISRWELDPSEVGIERAPLDALRGGTADENAQTIRSILEGERGPRRDVVLLNAAAGLAAAGVAADIQSGIERAGEAVDSGEAARVLDGLVRVSSS